MSSPSIRAQESRGARPRFPGSLLELVQRADVQTKVGAGVLVALAWVPVVFFCAIYGLTPLRSFLSDFAVESRFLIVISLLVLAESPLLARLWFITGHLSVVQ